jgi:hypothetical protein
VVGREEGEEVVGWQVGHCGGKDESIRFRFFSCDLSVSRGATFARLVDWIACLIDSERVGVRYM